MVARAIRRPLRTVEYHLHRLLERGLVLSPGRGLYANAASFHDLTADPLSILGFQNLRIRVSGLREAPPPPCRIARPWDVVPGGDAGPFEKVELAWEGRRVSIRRYPSTGTYEVVIAAQVPIPLEKAGELYGWLSAQLGLGQGERAEVAFIEVNAGHRTYRMEEHYLELRDLPGVSHVLYQKSAELREEYRIANPTGEDGKTLPLARAIELLIEGSPIARLERILKLELEVARLAQPGTAGALRKASDVAPGDAAGEGFG